MNDVFMTDRRSRSSNYSSMNSKIGSSQIPSTLGTTITGALANIPFPFGIDSDGNYGYKKAGADTVIPFKTGGGAQDSITVGDYSGTITGIDISVPVVLTFSIMRSQALSITLSGDYTILASHLNAAVQAGLTHNRQWMYTSSYLIKINSGNLSYNMNNGGYAGTTMIAYKAL